MEIWLKWLHLSLFWFFMVTNCYHVLFVDVNGYTLIEIFLLKYWLWHILLLSFHYFWFNTIIFFRFSFIAFFILFISMFFVQVSCTTIIFTWRIIILTCLIISTANVVFLIFKWWRCFFYYLFFHQLHYPLLTFYFACMVLEYLFSLWSMFRYKKDLNCHL